MSNFIHRRIKAISPAFKGLFHFFKTEENAWFHAGALLLAFALCYFLKVSTTEWLLIFFVVVLVLSTELLNSGIEKLCDFVEPNHDERIGIIKDLAAGGVLMASVLAVIMAVVIFGPKILAMFE